MNSPQLFSETQISNELKNLKGWKLVGNEITKLFSYKNFVEAMGFVNKIALCAEKFDHHPDIDIRWNKVTITLSTHSAGGITENDFVLAKEIENVK